MNEVEMNPPRRGRPPLHREDAGAVADRPEMRGEVRDEDPRAKAERRANEILASLGDNIDVVNDDFYIDPTSIPDGWDYNWKRYDVLGQSQTIYLNGLRQTGWDFVPASRHPEKVGPDYKDSAIIIRGMVLMERPKIISDRIKSAYDTAARDQMRAKERQLNDAPPGTNERVGTLAGQQVIRKSWEPGIARS